MPSLLLLLLPKKLVLSPPGVLGVFGELAPVLEPALPAGEVGESGFVLRGCNCGDPQNMLRPRRKKLGLPALEGAAAGAGDETEEAEDGLDVEPMPPLAGAERRPLVAARGELSGL